MNYKKRKEECTTMLFITKFYKICQTFVCIYMYIRVSTDCSIKELIKRDYKLDPSNFECKIHIMLAELKFKN